MDGRHTAFGARTSPNALPASPGRLWRSARPKSAPSLDLDDPIISAAVSAYEDAVATAIAAAETLPPAPTTVEAGRHVALLKTAQVAAPPDSYNPNLAPTPHPHDFQRTRPSRANARNITLRDRAERVHNFFAASGKDTEYYSVDTLEQLFAPLRHDQGLTEYEGEMLIIETYCGDKAAAEFDEMYGDPKTRDKAFGPGVTGRNRPLSARQTHIGGFDASPQAERRNFFYVGRPNITPAPSCDFIVIIVCY